jgi:hypothetical protein
MPNVLLKLRVDKFIFFSIYNTIFHLKFEIKTIVVQTPNVQFIISHDFFCTLALNISFSPFFSSPIPTPTKSAQTCRETRTRGLARAESQGRRPAPSNLASLTRPLPREAPDDAVCPYPPPGQARPLYPMAGSPVASQSLTPPCRISTTPPRWMACSRTPPFLARSASCAGPPPTVLSSSCASSVSFSPSALALPYPHLCRHPHED